MPLRSFLSSRRFFLLASLLAIVLLAIATWTVWRDVGRLLDGVDDADIFFVYARNIVHGHGIVYNAGGEHVEGASSLLYLSVCSLVWLLSPRPEQTLFVLDFLCVALLCVLLFHLFRRVEAAISLPRGSAPLLFGTSLLWLLLNPSFFAWCIVALMDEGMYSLLLVSGFVLLARCMLDDAPPSRRYALQLSAVIALTVLVRPEGVAWGLLESLLFAAIVLLRARKPASPRPLWALPALTLVVTYLALTGFRELYFGYPLPNTYYAKVTAARWANLHEGLHYFHLFLEFYGLFLLLPFLLSSAWFCVLVLRRHRLTPLFGFTLVTLAFVSLGLLVPVLEGGEHFTGFRMYQAIYPLLCVTAVLPLLPLLRRKQGPLALGGLAALTLLYALTTHSTWAQFRSGNAAEATVYTPTSVRLGFELARDERVNGRQLHTLFAPHLPTLGFAAAGGIAYGYDGPVFDMLGLNNTRMAHADRIKIGIKDHASFNKAVFYSLAPDILMPSSQPASTPVDLNAVEAHYLDPLSFESQIYKGLFSDPRFQAEYKLALVQSPQHPNLTCYGFFRRDYLNQLLANDAFQLLKEVEPPSQPNPAAPRTQHPTSPSPRTV